jgi:hypothetical protein
MKSMMMEKEGEQVALFWKIKFDFKDRISSI